MNRDAERHLTKARAFFEKGNAFYWKAGEEIIAAKAADPTLTNAEVGKWFGRGEKWVRTIVHHVTTSVPGTEIDWPRGSRVSPAQVIEAIEDEETREKVISTDRGLAAAVRLGIDARTASTHIERPSREELPPPSHFVASFWRAVTSVQHAHEELEKFGLDALEPNALEAAARMRKQAGEIYAAIHENAVETRIAEEV